MDRSWERQLAQQQRRNRRRSHHRSRHGAAVGTTIGAAAITAILSAVVAAVRTVACSLQTPPSIVGLRGADIPLTATAQLRRGGRCIPRKSERERWTEGEGGTVGLAGGLTGGQKGRRACRAGRWAG